MNDVADYDLFSYDYSTYWKKRHYENLAENYLIKGQLKDCKGNFFLDIGGSYGRLIDTYYGKYKHPVILDYSLKTLQKNYPVLQKKYPDLEMIAANAYKMPFRESSINAGLMVRVLHHIEKPEDYFAELSRILTNESIYIQEFANKVHLKASIRAICKLNFSFFDQTPYNHPLTKSNAEGTDKGIAGIFYNFHPNDVKNKMEDAGFDILEKKGCSFLRSPFLKKFLSDNVLFSIEKVQQKLLSWTNIPPSIFYKAQLKKKSSKNTNEKELSSLEDVLVCPECKGELKFTKDTASCDHCKKKFTKKNNIWDFRVM